MGNPPPAPRLLVLGTPSTFTRVAVEALRAGDVVLAGLVFPRTAPGVAAPRTRGRDLSRDAVVHSMGCPVFELGRFDHPDALALLARLAPDLVVVACFPRRVPLAWRAAPLGCWNIHPSLLPAYRGPVPLFWQLLAGETRTGVSVHEVDDGWDTGPILAVRAMALPPGATAEGLDAALARVGAELVLDRLRGGGEPVCPQDEAAASAQGFPGPEDRIVPTTWTASRAFNFLKGAEAWGPFRVRTRDGRETTAGRALDWSLGGLPGLTRGTPGSSGSATGALASEPKAGVATVAFADGWVRVATSD